VAAAATAAALVLAPGASAHGRSQVNALDFVARITSTGADAGALRARVLDGDRKLELRVAAGHTVVVRGYGGEPFLRFSSVGVDVNEHSLTALTLGLVRGSNPALSPTASPTWSSVSSRHRFAWHDHRLGPRPDRRYAEGDVAGWAVPIVVDSRPDRIVGRLLHERGPPLWPWLGLFAAAVVAGGALAGLRLDRIRTGVTLSAAACACAAALLLSIALGFVPGRSVAAAWGSAAFSSVIAAAAIPVLVLARGARRPVAGAIGLFAALAGVSHVSVLTHGFVIAALPTMWTRVAAAVAVCAGTAAAVSGGVSLFVPDPRRGVSSRPRPGRGPAVSRQRVSRR
jgi:hypothetical protein